MSITIPGVYNLASARVNAVPAPGDYSPNLPEVPILKVPAIKLESLDNIAKSVDTPEYDDGGAVTWGALSGAAIAAAYSSANSTLSFASPEQAVVPSYALGGLAPVLQTVDASAPDLSYPQRAPLVIPDDAGITQVARGLIAMGERPDFLKISPEVFVQAQIDMFDETAPEYTLPTEFVMRAPAKLELDVTAIKTALTAAVAYNPVLAQHVLEEMFIHATEFSDQEEVFAEQGVMSAEAARGFSMPTGAATAKVLESARKALYTRVEASFSARDEAYNMTFERVVKGVAAALAMDKQLQAVHFDYYAKLIETQKFNVKMHINLFDQTAALFNAKVKTLGIQVQAYNQYVQAVTAQYDGFNSQLAAESARVSSYNADVEAYASQIGTMETISKMNVSAVEEAVLKAKEYQAYIEATGENVKLIKLNLEGYRAAIGAYAKYIEQDSAKMSAYGDQVAAESSVIQVTEANIAAYASYWSAERVRSGAYEDWAGKYSSVLNAETSEYREYTSAYGKYITTLTDKVKAEMDALRSYGGSVDAVAAYSSEWHRTEAAVKSFNNGRELVLSDRDLVLDILDQQREAEEYRLEAARLGAEITIAAGYAQAAYSAISTSASISGSASASSQGSESKSFNTNANHSRSYQYSKQMSLSV